MLYWLESIPEFQFLDFSLDPGWFGIGGVAFLLVWLLNLFNFMDGIDGIAASEAIFVSSAGAFFCWLLGSDTISIILLILAVSTAGFLALNWPPEKNLYGGCGQ
jgi:Fuc2NAc and GlcNAc transferase